MVKDKKFGVKREVTIYFLPSIVFNPFCRKLELSSFKVTDMLFMMKQVAIPEPMRPPPITATFFIFLGWRLILVILGTWENI